MLNWGRKGIHVIFYSFTTPTSNIFQNFKHPSHFYTLKHSNSILNSPKKILD